MTTKINTALELLIDVNYRKTRGLLCTFSIIMFVAGGLLLQQIFIVIEDPREWGSPFGLGGMAIFFITIGSILIFRLIRFSIPEKTPAGKLLLEQKHHVTGVFLKERKGNVFGLPILKKVHVIVLHTSISQGADSEITIAVPRNNFKTYFDLMKYEFRRQNIRHN